MSQFSFIIQLVKRIGIALLIFTICRVLFYAFNTAYFPNVELGDFIYALRFDLSAISWIFLPFIFLSVIPFEFRASNFYQLILKTLFHLSNSICIILNVIDIEYFKFTLKRSTSDLFQLMQMGDDVTALIPTFMVDFWYIILFGMILMILSEWLYRKTNFSSFQPQSFSIVNTSIHTGIMIVAIAFFVITSRGGLQLIPISVIDAGFYTQTENVPLVLNTPFAFMKSLENQKLEEKNYFSNEKAESIVPLIKKSRNQYPIPEKPNIVILVMESFSNEYIGFFNPISKFTPHLDEILNNSLTFTHCFANGKKSIEGVPAITAGLPTLMDNPFISSQYSTNQFNSLPSLLHKIGYSSSFYHGGKNGTMGFEAFCDMAEFEEYIGMDQYPNPDDYDGNWGIFDEPFFQYFANELDKKQEPFFSTFFSLSSHHPYTIPEQHKDKFNEGPLDILKSVMYADYSLHQFFETAKTKPWFDNTLFVITADHTSQLFTPQYNNNVGNYAIPLAFYWPSKDSLFHGVEDQVVQQIDIMPSLLEIINYPIEYFAFGNAFQIQENGYSISYINGKYQLIQGEYVMQYDGIHPPKMFHHPTDWFMQKNLKEDRVSLYQEMEEKIKAFIQLYNNRMINNQLLTK